MNIQNNNILRFSDSLIYFVNNAIIPIYQGSTLINLMDLFPKLKEGFGTFTMFDNIFKEYISSHQLLNPIDNDRIIPDDLLNDSFNGVIPSGYYVTIDNDYIPMNEAIKNKIIPNELNSFQVIEATSVGFNPLDIELKQFYKILPLNLELIKNIPDYHYLTNDNIFIDELNIELSISRELSNVSSKINNDVIVKNYKIRKLNIINTPYYPSERLTFNGLFAFTNIDWILLNKLIENPWIHLLYSITMKDVNFVESYILQYDPRTHNNEAYKLALSLEDSNIIETVEIVNLIRDYSIMKLFYETQIMKNNNIVRDIYGQIYKHF